MSACDACLRRSNVIATLAPRIEGLLQRPSDRVRAVLCLPDEDLVNALVPEDRMHEAVDAIGGFDPDAARQVARDAGADLFCPHHDGYPELLRDKPDSPPVLWARGRVDRLDELLGTPAVALVGSRRASAYGLEVAEELGRGLSAAGVTVISGMALGIDAAAHRGALCSADPRTIAVLGSGVDVPYPRANLRLYDEIRGHGVILSEVPPGRRPFRWTFPARNRIMAALAEMTVVVEAAEPSGSLITAEFATDLGRSVGAVPGRVTSSMAAGSNRLLRDGAHVVRHAGDVLDELFGAGAAERIEQATPELGGIEQSVLIEIEQGADSGSIAAALGLEAGEARAVLGRLEMLGVIKRTGIGSYQRTAGRHP